MDWGDAERETDELYRMLGRVHKEGSGFSVSISDGSSFSEGLNSEFKI